VRESALSVLVIFQKKLDAVPGLSVLLRALHADQCSEGLILRHLLIYDNSPEPSAAVHLPPEVQYVHDASNGGTRAAYLTGLAMAEKLAIEWMLLLDHDTDLPVDFLAKSSRRLENIFDRQTVAALVPTVRVKGRIASPARISRFGRVTPIRSESDFHPPDATAIASGALIRTRALASITPIPEAFRLDYLDHWVFRALQSHGHTIAMSNTDIAHALSVWSRDAVPPSRFRSILAAEHEFLKTGRGYSRAVYACWVLLRTIRLAIQTRRWPLVAVCVSHLQAIIR